MQTADKVQIPHQFKPQIIVGIDPDSKESGVGVVYRDSRSVNTMKFAFPQLIDYLTMTRNMEKGKVLVVVEGGWLNRSNWHLSGGGEAKAADIGRRTGMNHQTGILIEQMCNRLDIPCTVARPLRKMWKGREGKITQAELQKVVGVTNRLPRMNQDQRDACLMAWVYAGLPVRV